MKNTLKIEIGLITLFLISAGIMLLGVPFFRYSTIVFAACISVLWTYKSFSKSEFGEWPWFGFLFSVSLFTLPISLALKLSIVQAGAFFLFLALLLSVLSGALFFVLILSFNKNLNYLKNVGLRLLPALTLGIIIYFTPHITLITNIYSDNPEEIARLEAELSYKSKPKDQKESILFVSNRNGNSDIFEINEDGSFLRPIIEMEGNQWSPRIDKSSNLLYFLSDYKSKQALYSFSFESSEINKVEEFDFDDLYFQIIHGQGIIYHDTIGGYYQVFTYDFDSKERKQITFDLSNNSKPFPNSESSAFYFQSDRNGNSDIYKGFTDSRQTERISIFQSEEKNPILSPYNDVMVFQSNMHERENYDLYYYVLNTKEIGRLTTSSALELVASFKSNAKDLVFGSNADGNWEIYLMSNKGEFKDRLTNHPSFDGDAIWYKRPTKK